MADLKCWSYFFFLSIEFVFIDTTEFSLVTYKSFCSDYYDCFLLCT